MLQKPLFSGKELAKHVVVISIDALSETEWNEVISLPNFSYLMENGSYTHSLKSVFPTHTYTVHTTMVTGVYPDKHGILHNHPLQPFVSDQDQVWHWYQREIQVPTIYDLAKQYKMSTASLLWPVTGKSSIRYNFPEMLAINGENQSLKILKNGSLFYLLDLELRLGKYRKSTEQPDFDDYVTLCAVDTIKRKKPNLTLIHLCDLDSTKHQHRIDGVEIKESLIRLDQRVGKLMEAVKDAGLFADTVFIVLGDHGQFNVDYNVHLNNLFRDAGLIYEEAGQLKWRTYLQTTGGNAFLHIQGHDPEAEASAIAILHTAMKDSRYGIEAIYDRTTLDTLHAHSDIRFAVEAKPGYHFHDSLSEVTVENFLEQGKKYATHGFSPEKPNYQCICIIAGNPIKKNISLGQIQMVDMAPTIAEILGLDFYPCDGKSLLSLLSSVYDTSR